MAAVSLGSTCAPMHINDSDWNVKECQRQRELEEARARAAQMVKTMKWWSECTANWREKWIKVRNELNKAREEIKHLRSNLEVSMKKVNTYKRDKQELEMQVVQLKQQIDCMVNKGDQKMNDDLNVICESKDTPQKPNSDLDCLKLCKESLELSMVDDASPEIEAEKCMSAQEKRYMKRLSTENDMKKINELETDMAHAEQIIKSEQNCNILLQKTVEKLQKENAELRKRQEQLYSSKQEAVRELLTIQELHRAEINIVNKALQEEMKIRENLEKSLHEKRNELDHVEKHQNEELSRRERLETEKLALERRNKMLSTEVRYYQDLFDHKGFPSTWRCERCGNTRPSSGAF